MSDTSAISPGQEPAAVVRGLYRGFLGREPDPAGLEYWSARLAGGAGAEALLAALLASDEYRAGQPAGSLAALRQRVLEAARPLVERELVVVDVGAQELADEDHVYTALTRHGLPYRIVGFEPQEDKIEQSRARNPDSRITLLPTFIGDGARQRFHINNDDATSSLLPFNPAVTAALRDLDHLSTVRTCEVDTVRLDDALAGLGPLAFLKLDIQGFELPALRHAPHVLARTAVVHCEVSFAPIYAGQALFSEVETLLRGAGFYLLDFHSLCRYASVDGAGQRSRDRLGWGDAIFVRDDATLGSQELLAQLLVLLLVYAKPSAAAALARRYDAATGAHLARLFEEAP
jgi:FkbM family methyltransferase